MKRYKTISFHTRGHDGDPETLLNNFIEKLAQQCGDPESIRIVTSCIQDYIIFHTIEYIPNE